MIWTAPEPTDTEGPMTGEERALLQGHLDHHRTTLLRICAGLTADQLVARPTPSALSLLGIVRHLAKVERIWLRQRVGGQDIPALYGGPGDPTDFADLDPARAPAEIAQLPDEWHEGDAAVRDHPLTHEIGWRGEAMSLRMIYLHLIGEYARHNGHADLIREAIDGVTGR